MGSRGPQPTKQTQYIVEQIRTGRTYRSIAEECSITRQRVGQIAIANGLRRQNQNRDGGTARKHLENRITHSDHSS